MTERHAHIPSDEPPQNPPPTPTDPDKPLPIREPGRDPRAAPHKR